LGEPDPGPRCDRRGDLLGVPRKWLLRSRWYWSEQYLLQAFLAFNPAFEILFAAQLATRAEPERVAALIPGFVPGSSVPASFWIKRSG
jgi:hypothetical protein